MSRPALVLAIFILSGAAGLIYEVVWARQLVLVFGNTTQAVSAILTGFFGGMAIGSAFGGRIADRVARPLRLFGLLEIALAAIVIVTPLTFSAMHDVYRSAFDSLETNPAGLTLIRFALSLLALAPATILMGATLPTLTRYLARDPSRLSSAFGRLYAANTTGAILGTILSGFILIETLGLSGTLIVGAACSLTSGAIALFTDHRTGSGIPASPATIETHSGPRPGRGSIGSRTAVVAGVSFASGFTSLGYQVLWTRLLASGTGNSTYVFTAILALFLTGLALGAIAFGWYRSRIENPVSFIAHGQIVIAILVTIGMLATISRQQSGVLGAGDQFGSQFLGFVAAVGMVVLPATFVMGLTFPAIAALVEAEAGRIGTKTGLMLSSNTLGAITGILTIPFLLVPATGSPIAVGILALANVAIALALVAFGGIGRALPRRVIWISGTVVALGIGGAMKSNSIFVDPAVFWISAIGRVFESREDQIASVQAGEFQKRRLWVTGTTMTVLTVDAKLMTLLPLILRPESRSALTVAFGMGTSFRTALLAGLRTDAVELVPSVPKMFKWFHHDAPSVLADPRGRVIIADGRNYVELTGRTYDILITDPPPPIESSGVSVIASREYYEAGRARLNRGGIMMQWIPYGQTVAEFKTHLRTYAAVFPHVIVAEGPGAHGFFLFGSLEPIAFDSMAIRRVISLPGVLADLSASPDSPDRTLAGWEALIPQLVWLEGSEVRAYAGDGPLITDDRPIPEYFLLRHLRSPPTPMTPADVTRRITSPGGSARGTESQAFDRFLPDRDPRGRAPLIATSEDYGQSR